MWPIASILAQEISWTEEPSELQTMGVAKEAKQQTDNIYYTDTDAQIQIQKYANQR